MHTIETTGLVTSDHQLVLRSPVPDDVPPGEHRVVVAIDSADVTAREKPPRFPPPHDIGVISDDFTFRREDLYGDDGR